MKFEFERLRKDIKNSWKGILFLILVIVGMNAIFHKVCFTRMFFGIPCPGCGLTRAFLCVAKGELVKATSIQPFWIPTTIMLFITFIIRYCISNERKSKKYLRLIGKCAIITIGLSIIFYIYRMIYWYPNREPMVYDPVNLINVIREMFIN